MELWDKEEACAQTREGRERAEDEGGESEREEESERALSENSSAQCSAQQAHRG